MMLRSSGVRLGALRDKRFEQQELLFEEEVFSDHSLDATWAHKLGDANKTMRNQDEDALHEYAILAAVL
jgi:hypothetical protein